MPFFFRIIAKNSKCNELPEVSLRRSPTSMTNVNETTTIASSVSSKKKSVSFKEDVESFEIKAEKDMKTSNGGVSGIFNAEVKKSPPRVESIKLKFDVSNNNVSIIKSDGSPKFDANVSHQKSKKEKKEKKNKLDNSYNSDSQNNKSTPMLNQDNRKDEYEFDDEIEKQKLGFLNTFQLTAKKMLMPKNNVASNDNKILAIGKKDNVEEGKKSIENNVNKRKSKESAKSEKSKKYKFHEMKSVGEGNKFLFTKTGDGHEITFDMSPKPLGSKPPLSKVKSDILMAQQRADAKAVQSRTETNSNDKNQATTQQTQQQQQQHQQIPQSNTKNVAIKPKKLPLLLPKQTPTSMPSNNMANPITSTSIAPTSMSPTAFVIKKPDLNKNEPEIASTAEISVTKLSDQNHHYRVYGPQKKNESKSKDTQFKSPSSSTSTSDVFAQPLPPKPKNNSPATPPTTLSPNAIKQQQHHQHPFGFSQPKVPKNIPENMQTPYGCRTPFYVPSSPSYTPNFDPKPQFKYANPNAYASFMQSMFSPSASSSPTNTQPDKISPPINSLTKVPSTQDSSRKRPSSESSNSVSSKRKSPSPSKVANASNGSNSNGTEPISILNKINFPSSLSVTLTNEQEENKKEQLRNQKQNVNNNIEIIKISEDNKEANKTKSPSPPKTGISNSVAENDKKSTDEQSQQKKIPELKKLSPILPATPNISMPPPLLPPPVAKALTDSKESFQRAFLESLMSVTNRADKSADKNSRKKDGKFPSVSPDALKIKSDSKLNLSLNDIEALTKDSKLESSGNKKNQDTTMPKKNLSLTPPLSKGNTDKLNTTALKSLTPPPTIPLPDHAMFSPQAVAASSAMQFNLMLNALNAAANGAPHFAFPDYANIQRTMLLETLRKNVEKSSALLAMHHQMQQHQQQNQKNSPNSPSSSSASTTSTSSSQSSSSKH
jgi:hypothetical protein